MAAMLSCSAARRPAGLRAAPVGRLACNVRASAAATVQEARKILVTQGWERAWVDGVTERISRKQIACSPQDMEDVIKYLTSLGLTSGHISHMAALAFGIFTRTSDQMAAVVKHLESRDVPDVANILFNHPKMLEYDVSADGLTLEKGPRSRIQVDITPGEDGANSVLVSYYRTGTKFNSAPIAAYAPA